MSQIIITVLLLSLFQFGFSINENSQIGNPIVLTNSQAQNNQDDNHSSVVVPSNEIFNYCLAELNAARAQNGVGVVSNQNQIVGAAQYHTDFMVRNNCFLHQCPGELGLGDRVTATGYRWRGIGEIIAAGASSCSEATNLWMNSPGHRAIILDGIYVHVGCYTAPCSSCTYHTYWTCVFAKPL